MPPHSRFRNSLSSAESTTGEGRERPYDYFSRHHERGAPWVFVVQNGIPHCCVINAKSLILEWLDEMMKLRRPASDAPLRRIDDDRGWTGFMKPCESDRNDTWGEPDWNVCDGSVQTAHVRTPPDEIAGAWLPTRRLALDWLGFIRQQKHPANSFPDGKDALHSQFAPGGSEPVQRSRSMFSFQDNFWLNLHQFLRGEVYRRRVNAAPGLDPASLTETDRNVWNRAVSSYIDLAKRDVLFDDLLRNIGNTLALVGDVPRLPGFLDSIVGANTVVALNSAAPIYRARILARTSSRQ